MTPLEEMERLRRAAGELGAAVLDALGIPELVRWLNERLS